MAMYEKYIVDGKCRQIFGFDIGDTLYVADKNKGVLKFVADCIKIHDHGTTVHGYVYGLYGKWGTPSEYNLKWLNKRVIFIREKDASEWFKSHRTEQQNRDR